MKPELTSLERTETAPAARVLARAFRDNPAMVAILEAPPERRVVMLESGFASLVEAVRRFGNVEVARDRGAIVAVALAFAPRGFPPPARFQLVAGRGFLGGGLRRIVRVARVNAWMRKLHLHAPHWYLNTLGVDPDHQGRGHGSALLRAHVGRADAERVACYLETDKESNVALYERHGYRVTSDQTGPLGVRLWFMER